MSRPRKSKSVTKLGLTRRRNAARECGMSELTLRHVLVDLFDSGEFDHEIRDPERAAEIVVQRLIDAGFEIKPAERCRT
jgi:hypothetical protein